MPLFSFVCHSCGKAFDELFLSKVDASLNEHVSPCPSCGHLATRVIGPTSVRFEGSGWTPKGGA